MLLFRNMYSTERFRFVPLTALFLITGTIAVEAFSLHLPFGGSPDSSEVKEKYDELTRLAARSDGACWRSALHSMRTQCGNLDEVSHARFGLHLTHCFLKQHGIGSIPCVLEWSEDDDANEPFNVTECLAGATVRGEAASESGDTSRQLQMAQIYSNFYLHTRNLCYYYSSRIWQERTLETVGVLSKTSEYLTQTLDDNVGLSRELKQDLSSFADTTHSLVAHTDKIQNTLNRVIDDTSTALVVHGQILNNTISHATSFVGTIDKMVTHFMSLRFMILGYLTGVQSVLFWVVASVSTYFVTCIGRTGYARAWVYLVFACNLFCELFVIPYYLLASNDPKDSVSWFLILSNSPNADIQSVRNFNYWCRMGHIGVAIVCWFWFSWRHRDIPQENNQLLQEIREENRSVREENRRIREMLENGGPMQNGLRTPRSPVDRQRVDESDSALGRSSSEKVSPFGRRPIGPGLVPPVYGSNGTASRPNRSLINLDSDRSNNNSAHSTGFRNAAGHSISAVQSPASAARSRQRTPSGRFSTFAPVSPFNINSSNNTSMENDAAVDSSSMDLTNLQLPNSLRNARASPAGIDNESTDEDGERSVAGSEQGRRNRVLRQRSSSRNSVTQRSVHDMSLTPLKNSTENVPATFTRRLSIGGGGSGSSSRTPQVPLRTASGNSPYPLRDTPSRQRAATNAGSASPLRASNWSNLIAPVVNAVVPERIEEVEEPVMDGRQGGGGGGGGVFSDDENADGSMDNARVPIRANNTNNNDADDDDNNDETGLNNNVQHSVDADTRSRTKSGAAMRRDRPLDNVFSSDEEDGNMH